jgi:pyruvate formate lyase activating enzyme
MTLKETLFASVREGELWEPLDGRRIRCHACGHRCPIFEGQPGVCRVRFNRAGKLYVPWGYVTALQCDPIEKKPFFHVRPGSFAMSFGMLGCDLHCGYCQNWITSQALRNPQAGAPVRQVEPEEIVEAALHLGADAVVSTYNEPLITAEWAVAVFKEAKAAGLLTGFVSNGNATLQALEYLRPWTDLYKVDLKSFDDRRYRELGGRLEPVLESIRQIHQMGFWLEVVTLVVPGFNDSDDELRRIADFLAGVSPDVPWHMTAFHNDYKMHDRGSTPAPTIKRAVAIGHAAGLRYVYAGNLGGLAELESTRCATCGGLLVRRSGFHVLECRLTNAGNCPVCGTPVPGRWVRSAS